MAIVYMLMAMVALLPWTVFSGSSVRLYRRFPQASAGSYYSSETSGTGSIYSGYSGYYASGTGGGGGGFNGNGASSVSSNQVLGMLSSPTTEDISMISSGSASSVSPFIYVFGTNNATDAAIALRHASDNHTMSVMKNAPSGMSGIFGQDNMLGGALSSMIRSLPSVIVDKGTEITSKSQIWIAKKIDATSFMLIHSLKYSVGVSATMIQDGSGAQARSLFLEPLSPIDSRMLSSNLSNAYTIGPMNSATTNNVWTAKQNRDGTVRVYLKTDDGTWGLGVCRQCQPIDGQYPLEAYVNGNDPKVNATDIALIRVGLNWTVASPFLT